MAYLLGTLWTEVDDEKGGDYRLSGQLKKIVCEMFVQIRQASKRRPAD